jgi:hypothetical protein
MSGAGKFYIGSRLYVMMGKESVFPLRHFFYFSGVLVISNTGNIQVSSAV